jgi:chromosomal replication initiator protein
LKNADEIWEKCRDYLSKEVGGSTWYGYLAPAQAVSTDEPEILLISVESELSKERIIERHLMSIYEALDSIGANDVEVDIVVTNQPEGQSVESQTEETELLFAPRKTEDRPKTSPNPVRTSDTMLVNRTHTFEAFVIGSSNRFAHAAALAVAEKPSNSYNPLFIHGHAGLGKTHLLNAIANYIVENYRDLTVRYVSTEAFLNDFVDSIRTNRKTAFKRRYRECDVLLMDDIQFLEGKEALQEEFFHTFNDLKLAGSQVVITSDRPPKAISTLEERLRSRFLSGLITDIQPPDIETRIAILQKKSDESRITIPPDVLYFIAENVRDNIRVLEGAFTRVTAHANLTGEAISIELVGRTITDLISSNGDVPLTAEQIIDVVSQHYGFTITEIKGVSRKKPLAEARQIAMYITRETTDLSFPAIGNQFGGRDHTTVMHSVKRVEERMSEDRETFNTVSHLLTKLRSQQV